MTMSVEKHQTSAVFDSLQQSSAYWQSTSEKATKSWWVSSIKKKHNARIIPLTLTNEPTNQPCNQLSLTDRWNAQHDDTPLLFLSSRCFCYYASQVLRSITLIKFVTTNANNVNNSNTSTPKLELMTSEWIRERQTLSLLAAGRWLTVSAPIVVGIELFGALFVLL